ncbi:MAG: glycosyltransferase family 2 protein [Rhodospirillales bacterium]
MNDVQTSLGNLPASRRVTFDDDAEKVLYLPETDVADPELSIVIPAMNEEAVMATFIAWCHEGILKAGVAAEILIVDSSDDRSPLIALENGARVLKTPKRGLGQAYRDVIPVIRGKYVIMGDADCTYDFREIEPFLNRFREGYEFILGSRFKGSIEDGAMPALHRYFGTPLTTAILNTIYGSSFSDIHCGMRGITLDALTRIRLHSRSWEYASEMVIKSVRAGLRRVEVPVHFYMDRDGRLSHHRRMGWFSPWYAGWINLRAMLIYGADFFVIKPGIVLLMAGLAVAAGLSLGPMEIGGITFSLNSLFLAMIAAVAGLQCLMFGAVAQILYDPGPGARRWLRRFPYTPTMVSAGIAFFVGGALCVKFVAAFHDAGYTVLNSMVGANHLAVFGLMLMILAFTAFIGTLLMHAVAARTLTNSEIAEAH